MNKHFKNLALNQTHTDHLLSSLLKARKNFFDVRVKILNCHHFKSDRKKLSRLTIVFDSDVAHLLKVDRVCI